MTDDPKKMNRAEILAKVLSINPSMRRGDQSAAEMSQELAQSIKRSKRGPRFSEEKFAAVFDGMLGELQGSIDKNLGDIEKTYATIDGQMAELREQTSMRIVDFLSGTHPGAVSDSAKEILRLHADLLKSIGTSITAINRKVRERSAEF